MASEAAPLNKAEAPGAATGFGPPWLLLCLTLLLIALAVFQLAYLVPRCMVVVQQFAGHWVPAPLRLLAGVPEWLGPLAGLLVAALAVWQRGSLRRVALVATGTLAVNVGLLLSTVGSLFEVLSHVGRP